MRDTRRFTSFVLATLLVFIANSGFAQERETGVIESYHGSPEMPDEIAFGEFLKIVDSWYGSAGAPDEEIVAAALGITLSNEDEQSFAMASSRSALFRNALVGMKREQAGSRMQILCSGDQASKSNDQINSALAAAADIDRTVLKKHYQIVTNTLADEEQKAFGSYLNDMKTGISYTRLDGRKYHDQQQLRAKIEQQCYESTTEFQLLGGTLQ